MLVEKISAGTMQSAVEVVVAVVEVVVVVVDVVVVVVVTGPTDRASRKQKSQKLVASIRTRTKMESIERSGDTTSEDDFGGELARSSPSDSVKIGSLQVLPPSVDTSSAHASVASKPRADMVPATTKSSLTLQPRSASCTA